ncbi:YoaK family protein [Utexia brackfieldae]|uniref:YoaK family protein n=1 Tax=Utexia brackfieldae TaxID=3074108 RepID=UPI00370D8560
MCLTKPTPHLVTLFVFQLAFNGGLCDVSSFLTLGVFSGHLTGNTVTSLVYLIQGNLIEFTLSIIALSGFILGSFSGIIWRKHFYQVKRLYLPLILQLTLIFIVFILLLIYSYLPWMNNLFIFGVSLALGLQNGFYTKIWGSNIHTNYITGTSTSWFEAILYTDKTDEKALIHRHLSLIIILGFVSGAATGALLNQFFGKFVFIAVVIMIALAIVSGKKMAHRLSASI